MISAKALAYAMGVMGAKRCPLSRAEAQGMLAEAFQQGERHGIQTERKRMRQWRRRKKSSQR